MKRTRERFVLVARLKLGEIHWRAVKAGLGEAKHPPKLTFDCRGHAAGRAWISASRIDLNIDLALSSQEAWDHILDHTLAHEYAHLTSFRKHGRGIRPHGREWANHCNILGIVAERCHNLDVSTVTRVKTFAYSCPCGSPHQLTSVCHNRVVKGAASYLCHRCKGRLFQSKGGV